jgi:DNA topoisomerase-3
MFTLAWSSCSPLELFTAPIVKEVSKESLDIERTLIEESRKCNVLMLWLDCDLEGENISHEVMSVCLKANPRMDVYRARFSGLYISNTDILSYIL